VAGAAGEGDAPLRAAMQAVAAGDTDAFRPVAEALDARLARFFACLGGVPSFFGFE